MEKEKSSIIKKEKNMTKDKDLKYLKTHYLCTANAGKYKVFDSKKGKQVKYRDRHGLKRKWPMIGFMCPICEIASSNMSHYLIDGESICEDCALKKLEHINISRD